ncbi:MAG: primosomal protein N' [Blautia sp.]|nr:primosomal protein N' [Blautia sp.]
MIYADIIIDISHEKLDRTFQYKVPDSLQDALRPGMVVEVPFGSGNHIRKGYVIGFSNETDYEPERIKEIKGLSNDGETTEGRLIGLAAWMKEYCGSTMIQALKTVLPVQEKIKAKEKRLIILTADREAAQTELQMLQKGRTKARARFLEALLNADGVLPYEEAGKIGAAKAVLDYFVQAGYVEIGSEEVVRTGMTSGMEQPLERHELTKEQYAAACAIQEEWSQEQPRPVLIHGVTGSGKTEVYMELIRQVLEQGRQVIVLIPEIALTYQTVRRFHSRFADKVSVLNSRMSPAVRYDQFKLAAQGNIQVMVGPRSALFTPFPDLGLIIIDEEHEASYKSENSPRYHARETAVKRAELEGANVVLGSATPSMEAYSRAKSGEYRLVKLESRFAGRNLPTVEIVDLREELKQGNRSMFSRKLREEMDRCLENQEQVMLFLNRRGYAGFVSCRACGTVMKCPHCDVSLSEHNNGKLICHYCGYTIPKPKSCPECGSPYIGGFKAGTQQIEQAIQRIYPKARVKRMDFDTTRKKGSYEEILSSFAAHEADILIGTQMIVKGHDFPDVTLVGVIAADMSLNADDYRCAERTFQLLTQAVGRSGRGEKCGKALIQTYHPAHYSIQTAAVQDYEAFYQEEMGYRMLMDYPPAARLMAILGAGEDEELLEQGMQYIAGFIHTFNKDASLKMIGPAPASVGKVKDVYRRVLYIKHNNTSVLVSLKNKVEKYIEINPGFRNMRIQFDFS